MARTQLMVNGTDVVFCGPDDAYLNQLDDGSEAELRLFASELLSGGAVVLDLGANIGVTSTLIALDTPGSRVIAVEAGPATVDMLRDNLATNGISNVEVVHAAVSDSNGRVHFHESSAFGHVTDDPHAIDIESVTVASLVERLGLDRVDLIKIDVEGLEPDVIEGCSDILQRLQPIVWMELNTWTLLMRGHDPIAAMTAIVERFGEVHRVRRSGGPLLDRVGDDHTPAIEIARTLIHDNIVRHHSWEDLVLVPPGRTLDLSLSRPVAEDDTDLLQRTIATMQNSYSWKITTPLRVGARWWNTRRARAGDGGSSTST